MIAAVQAGLPLARSEYLCADSIRAINAATPGLQLRQRPTLFLEFHGSPAAVEEQSALLRELAQSNGGEDFTWAERPEERTRLWEARHRAYYSCRVSRAGAEVILQRLNDQLALVGVVFNNEQLELAFHAVVSPGPHSGPPQSGQLLHTIHFHVRQIHSISIVCIPPAADGAPDADGS